MLPNKHFNGNDTNPDHWLGLVDGIYAICITIMSLELPSYIANLENINSLVGLRGMFVIATMDGLAYACLFFVMYELWSYHRAVVKTVSLNKRWQNLTNVTILLLTTVFPAFLLERIKYRTEMTLNLVEKSGGNLMKMKEFLLHHESGYFAIIFIVFICFFLIGRLMAASKSDIDPKLYAEITHLIHQKSVSFFLIAVLSLIVSVYSLTAFVFLTNLLLFVYVAEGFWDKRPSS